MAAVCHHQTLCLMLDCNRILMSWTVSWLTCTKHRKQASAQTKVLVIKIPTKYKYFVFQIHFNKHTHTLVCFTLYFINIEQMTWKEIWLVFFKTELPMVPEIQNTHIKSELNYIKLTFQTYDSVRNATFCHMILCSLVEVCWHFSKTSVNFYQLTWQPILEDSIYTLNHQSFSQMTHHRKKLVKKKDVPLGETTLQKIVNSAAICMGLSPDHLIFLLLPL